METTVLIVGAGPVGSYLGMKLSKAGISNIIVEEHAKIGEPEQCTGLFSTNLDNYVKIPESIILNRLKGAIFCCKDKKFELRTNKVQAYVTDRIKFDMFMAEEAKRAGSKFLLAHKFVGFERKDDGFVVNLETKDENKEKANKTTKKETNKIKKTIKAKYLVGADGPSSAVGKAAGIYGNRKFWIGAQVFLETKKPMFEKDLAYLYLDRKYSQDFFAWVVPMSKTTAKVGTAVYTKPKEYLDRFLKDKFPDAKITGYQGGLIPYYSPETAIEKGNVFLIGDAAEHVKATTGGGVINGFWAADELVKGILEGHPNYEKRAKNVRKNLNMHLLVRNKINKFDDEKYAELLEKLNKPSVQSIMKEHGDMDFPRKFAFKLLIKNPGLIRYTF